MGLLDLFRRKAAEQEKAAESPDTRTYEIPVESLPGWLREQSSHELERAYSEAAEAARRIEQAFESIRSNSAHFGKARLQGTGREANAANMIKDSFVKAASKLSSPPQISVSSYSGILDYHSKASEALSGLLTPKQAFVLNNYFREKSTTLVGHIKQAHNMLDSLAKVSQSKLKHVEDAEKQAAEILRNKGKLEGMKEEKGELEAETEALKQKLDAAKRAMKEAENSPEMSALQRLAKELEACKARKQEIADTIRQLPAKKALRKTQYSAEKAHSLSHHELSVLREFIREPLCVLNNNRIAELLAVIIRKAMETTQEKEDIEKLLAKLQGEVPRLVNEYDSLEKRIAQIRSETSGSPVQKNLERLHEEAASLETLIVTKTHRLQKLAERLAIAEKELAESKASLAEYILANFGKNVVLV